MKKILLLIIAAVMSFQSIFAQAASVIEPEASVAEESGSYFIMMTLMGLLFFIMPGCLLYKVVMQAITKKEVSFFKCLFKTLITIVGTIFVVAILGAILGGLSS